MSDEPLVPTFVPALITLLAQAEREKGAALTRDEVESIRDRGVCIMLPQSEASRMAEASGHDIDPDEVWAPWQAVRATVSIDARSPKPQRGRFRQLTVDIPPDSLSVEAKERHEAFIDIFGRQIFSIRNEILERTRALIEAPQSVRDEMGTIHSKEYTAASQLPAEAQQVSLDLSRKAIDAFLRELLVLFTHSGLSTDLALGSNHAIAYKLLLQVMQTEDLEVVEEHALNDGGEKVFYEYYGRWLNRHRDA
jgi:hypothetical protein